MPKSFNSIFDETWCSRPGIGCYAKRKAQTVFDDRACYHFVLSLH